MKRKHVVLLSAVMLFVFSMAFSAQAQPPRPLDENKFYTSHNGLSSFGTIDLDTGAGSDVGPYQNPDLDITRTGWPAGNGAIYRGYFYVILNRRIPLDEDPPHVEARLGRVNPDTAEVELLGSPIYLNLMALEISQCGEMYATGFSLTNALGHWYGDMNLYRVDMRDATVTLVGYTGIDKIMDLSFDPEGNLWATVGNVLYTLDTETGAPTAVSTITGVDDDAEIMGIGFTSDGELFGTSPYADGLYNIDPASGVATKVGNHGFVIPHGGDIPMTPYDTRCPEPEEDYSNTFFMELESGLNMISLPLKLHTPLTARDLMNQTGATVVIEYDTDSGRFVGFTEASSGDGFPIEGGKGYIVNARERMVVPFVGAAWTNDPPVEAAPPAVSASGWAFVLSGAMTDYKEGDYTVTVRNLRTGAVATDNIKAGRFNAVFADLNRNAVVAAGDKVEVIIMDSANRIIAGPVTHQIGQYDIRKAFRDMVIPYGYARPEKSVLLQNYPNPFNPETWIPFHLSKEADVSVRIYDSVGRLVRSLALGRRTEGIYVDKSKAIYWDGKNDSGEEVASGIYYYSITAGDFSATRKMIVKK